MPYSEFRRIVMDDGWRSARASGPFETPLHSRAWELVRENGWTEALDCGGSFANCLFEFEDWGGTATLAVATVGEQDDPSVVFWSVEGEPRREPAHDGVAARPSIAWDDEGGCALQWELVGEAPVYDAPRDDAGVLGTIGPGGVLAPENRVEALSVLRAYGVLRATGDLEIQVVDPDPETRAYHRPLSVPAGALVETTWDWGNEGVGFRFDGAEYRGEVPATRDAWARHPEYRRAFVFEQAPVVDAWVRLAADGTMWMMVSGAGFEDAEPDCEED